MAEFRPFLAEHGLTDQQWRIIRTLFDGGELEPRQLGEYCQISSPSISGVLTRMEAMGLVVRKPVEGDRRRLHVALTARGRRIAQSITPKSEAKYQELEKLLGLSVMQQAYDTLDTLLTGLQEKQGD